MLSHDSAPAMAEDRRAPVTAIEALAVSIARSPIVTGTCAPACRPVPAAAVTARGLTPLDLWARRQPSGDVDTEILRWIAAQAKRRGRLRLS